LETGKESQAPQVHSTEESDPLAAPLSVLAGNPRDPGAWQELYYRLWPWLVATMYRGLWGMRALAGDSAQDAAQQVLFKLLRFARFDRGDSPAQFRSFVRAVSAGVVADLRRAQAREHELLARSDRNELIRDAAPSPEHTEVAHDLFESLLARLEERDRGVAELLVIQRAPPRDIALILSRDTKEVYEAVARIKRAARSLFWTIGGKKPVKDSRRLSQKSGFRGGI
jgi:RNA polymerase sigma factor (sigma-70 family)